MNTPMREIAPPPPTPKRRGRGKHAPPGRREVWAGSRVAKWVQRTLAEYGTTCWLCGLPGADSADHVVPRSQGGAVYDMENLAPAHKRCNIARGDRDVTPAAKQIESRLHFFNI
ncbi:HNH endonuclease [Gulosibacter bifidus]|uniref:HNH endonuclease n=1 Tax=Gulosibacter bifidus TaxID=272239 RepID=A0ABW5RIW3_9MICO